MGDPTVFVVVYGLALAPLGMAALSLPVRKWAERLPWRRAQHRLVRWASDQGWAWSHPTHDSVRIQRPSNGSSSAEGALAVTCSPGAGGPGSFRTVGYRLEVELDLPEAEGVVFDGRSQAVVAGDTAWGWAIAGTGLTSGFDDRMQHVQVADGRFVLSTYGSDLEASEIDELVERMNDAVRRLSGRSLVQVLRHHALNAVDPLHRRRCLAAFLVQDRSDRSVSRQALSDPDPDVRLVAAVQLCPDSDARAEIRSQLHDAFDEDIRLRALEAARQVAPSELDHAWESLFAASSVRLARRAVEVARLLGQEARLHGLVRSGSRDAARIAAIEALERPDDRDFESLCAELAQTTRGHVRICAVDALGRVGGTDRTGLLRRIGSEAPINSELFIACRAAVDLIQARCVAGAGSLSLLDPSQGIRGRLSVPQDDGSPKAGPNPQSSPR